MNAIAASKCPAPPELVVGLVNNMPQAAFAATDRQFFSLLQAGASGRRVRLRRFAADPTPAGYEPIDRLWSQRLDGLVVTGAEPQAETMEDEPSWDLLARLVDWAADHTRATIWSCLAAHAAVFRLDGVTRRRLPQKLSGVFTCRRAGPHALLENAPTAWPVPHSRFNDLDTDDLERAGYTILSRGPGRAETDGADAFVKPVGASVFLMLQGHPEYTADTLLREYRRDLRRWLQGADRPAAPSSYFPLETEALLSQSSDPTSCLAVLECVPEPAPNWLPHSVTLYRSWLASMNARTPAEVGLSIR